MSLMEALLVFYTLIKGLWYPEADIVKREMPIFGEDVGHHLQEGV